MSAGVATRIRVLPESLIRKIAAGEVIERPASVVKELVENALDAQAGRIQVEIQEGGRQAVIVADDGLGMTREDAELSVARHATSKLSSPTGLFAIETLGFRGEALASIGAVSRLTIDTRAEEDDEGTRVVVEGGVQREVSAVARARGTTVAVRSLFFNTPARRRFLRQVETESRYTAQAVLQLAVAHPGVGFGLSSQDRVLLALPPADRRGRAGEVLGVDPGRLLTGRQEGNGIVVEAAVCSPSECRRARSKQFIVVRSRPIASRSLSQSVYRGYGSLLAPGSHPAFVLWLELDPRQVDVNVHPAKREVRFAEENRICELVEGTVRQALGGPAVAALGIRADGPQTGSAGQVREPVPGFGARLADGLGSLLPSLSLRPGWSPAGVPVGPEQPGAEPLAAALRDLGDAAVVWQVHARYLVVPVADGLAVVDQHVAHERVLYEQALERLSAADPVSQQLLFPLTVDLNAAEYEVVRGSLPLLERLGFAVRAFGPGAYVVDAVPVEVRGHTEVEILRQIVDDLLEDRPRPGTELQQSLAASYACHTSIRAGQNLPAEERLALLQRLISARDPYTCPHGRPTIVRIPLAELDRMFGRA